MKIYAKLHDAKKSIESVKKNAKNPHFKNSYADLNALLDAVEPILLDKGLLLLQPIFENRVFTQVIDIENGEKLESYVDLPASTTPQQLGSAITYYRRYTLQSLLSLQAVDDDGNDASKPQAPKKIEMDAVTFEKAKHFIINGETTLDAIKKKYILTGAQNIELLNINK